MTMHTIGKNSVVTSVNGSFGAYKLVGPEQNLHGVILRTMNGYATTVVVSATPPAKGNGSDGKVIAFSTTIRTEPFLVPAGLGIYFFLSPDYNQVINATWDYLNADGTVA
ncbi:hypothetical protein DJ028_08435 [Pseudomonas veronii]|uniref:hypothetical protein n=1 Tax=Pseudomonas veronii TaxID=76761 RepID=UPI000FE376C5|nr:hypothetical protein [Pseudomonas veronii]RWA28004.1 hypothetical protein DJ028_08435 [Pseudomonas veronii]